MVAVDFVNRMRPRLGPVGVFQATFLGLPLDDVRTMAARIEALGFGSLFIPEGLGGREAFCFQSLLLAASEKLVCGTAIANLWARHPSAMQGGAELLAEAHPGRFVLGIGVSHAAVVTPYGLNWAKPLETMGSYLAGMDAAAAREVVASAAALVEVGGSGGEAIRRTPRLLGALGPRMLELARDRAEGAISYFVPPEHTASARRVLGPDRLLIVEQAVVTGSDPAMAMSTAREHVAPYLFLPNYSTNLVRLGYGDDVTGGGSDRLIHDLVAMGTVEQVAERVQRHHNAGADHVLLQPVGDPASVLPQLEELAPTVCR